MHALNGALRASDASAQATAAAWLTRGGDARIVADAAGRNQYGCPATPDPALAELGSCTASVISEAGMRDATALLQRLRARPQAGVFEAERIRAELLALCGLSEMDGVQAVLGASGTDMHLIAAQLAQTGKHRGLRVVMASAAETGTGVPNALASRQFSELTPLGTQVRKGTPIRADDEIEVVEVALRHPDGSPRTAHEVDDEFVERLEEARRDRMACLLVLTDVSKTGMIAPSPACALALRARWSDGFEVLVDACQFRVSPASLHAYLAHDFLVAVTGSKFVTGPTFSGALLVGPEAARRLAARPLDALRQHSLRLDWPLDWRAADGLAAGANLGLLLRWQAALTELRAFRAVPQARVGAVLDAFARTVRTRLANDPAFAPIAVPAIDRGPISTPDDWDRIPTIFPFALRGLDDTVTRDVHRRLREPEGGAVRFQLGQPVRYARREGHELTALRICASARLVVDAAGRPATGLDRMRAQVHAAFDRTAALAERMATVHG